MDKNKIFFKTLPKVKVEEGDILKIFNSKEQIFNQFGEAYFSFIKKDKIKAWKLHKRITMNISVPLGEVLFVFYSKENNNYEEFILGENNYGRLIVPPNKWFGFKGIHNEKSLIINITNEIHDPQEIKRLKLEDLDYKWFF